MESLATPLAGPELQLIRTFIRNGQTVVDISAGSSGWTDAILSNLQQMRVLLYASPASEQQLLESLPERLASECARCCEDGSGRNLDSDMAREGIRHIHFLRIAEQNDVREVLSGATRLLTHSRIDIVQFSLDTFDFPTTQSLISSLVNRRYLLLEYRVIEGMEAILSPFVLFDPQRARSRVTLLAVHERLMKILGLVPVSVPAAPMIPEICAEFHIKPHGIIHVGAHEGTELRWYQSCGFSKIVFIEANPKVYERLRAHTAGAPGVVAIQRAVMDRSGPVALNVTSFDQSSSVLPLGTHLQHYPSVHSVEAVTVEGDTLDAIVAQHNLAATEINFLAMDIQGAEALALRGARNTLAGIQVVITEVHFEDLYRGCAQIDDIDLILEQYGFKRVKTYSIHPAWGDAVYVKNERCTAPGVQGFS